MTYIHPMEDGHRRWDRVDRDVPRPADRPATGGANPDADPAVLLGDGPLRASLIAALAAIEVPPKEEVATSVAFVTERIGGEAGAGLAAQANVQPSRAVPLLAD